MAKNNDGMKWFIGAIVVVLGILYFTGAFNTGTSTETPVGPTAPDTQTCVLALSTVDALSSSVILPNGTYYIFDSDGTKLESGAVLNGEASGISLNWDANKDYQLLVYRDEGSNDYYPYEQTFKCDQANKKISFDQKAESASTIVAYNAKNSTNTTAIIVSQGSTVSIEIDLQATTSSAAIRKPIVVAIANSTAVTGINFDGKTKSAMSLNRMSSNIPQGFAAYYFPLSMDYLYATDGEVAKTMTITFSNNVGPLANDYVKLYLIDETTYMRTPGNAKSDFPSGAENIDTFANVGADDSAVGYVYFTA